MTDFDWDPLDDVDFVDGGLQPTFFPEYPVNRLRGAPYNPRRLDDESFTRLQASLGRYGIVKPVIANGDGTLVAGNQRHRTAVTLGMTTIPAVILQRKVSSHHEIYFNLAHNAVEHSGGHVTVPPHPEPGWVTIPWEHVTVHNHDRIVPVTTTGKLIARYGAYGSIVASTNGTVVANLDYAHAATRVQVPVLVRYVTEEHATELRDILQQQFGVYDQTVVAEQWKAWAIQPTRAAERDDARQQFRKSPVWEHHVIPRLQQNPKLRVLDLGAGKLAYTNRLRKQGYHVIPYEPYMTKPGTKEGERTFDMRAIVTQQHVIRQDIEQHGLYDIVVLDNVINAATNEQWHTWITATANALVHPDGIVAWSIPNGTNAKDLANSTSTGGRSATTTRTSVFWTPDDYTIAIRWGQFITMKYHTPTSIHTHLRKFFTRTTIPTSPKNPSIHGTCQGPRQLTPEQLHETLTNELNPPYPNGYRHNHHQPLLNTITTHYQQHTRPHPTNWPLNPATLDT